MLKLDLGLLPLRVKSNPIRPKRPAWYKATEKQIVQYSETLKQKISTVPVPSCLQCQDVKCDIVVHTEARDGFVLDLLGAVIESFHVTIPMVGGGQGRVKADSGCMLG
jgi:hypothetical protein